MRCSSSTDSDEFTPCTNDPNRISLQIITNQGQSNVVETEFMGLVNRLDPDLNIISVTESSSVIKLVKDYAHNQNQKHFPSLSVVLFFNDQSENQNENDFSRDAESTRNNFREARDIFDTVHWRFHHKVAVTGKLATCDSNVQDYFEYSQSFTSHKGGSPQQLLDNQQCCSFPLWGIRKVHYGKRILRFTCFVSSFNWEDQVNFYKLILRGKGTKVRDDFCFFDVFSNPTTVVQFALKKLPPELKPDAIKSSILQFKVKNVGHLVPLFPHSCEPISALRWRTRDHDGNTVLLQIQCLPRDGANEQNFAENVFEGHGTPPGFSPSRGPSPATSRGTGSAPATPGNDRRRVNNANNSNSRLGDSFICPELPEKMPLLKPALYRIPKHINSSSSSDSTERSAKSESQKAREVKTNKTVFASSPTVKKRPKTPQENMILKVQNRKTEPFYV